MLINNVLNFVQDKTFEEVVNLTTEEGIDVKSNDHLYLLTANRTAEETELNQQCNGIVFEKETNKVVCSASDKIVDLQNWSDAVSLLSNDSDATMKYCEDGTVIRLYNYNGKWYTSTKRCIDAEFSFWTSQRSFADLFWEIFDVSLLETLDDTYTYVFVLLHSDNRIVVKHSENSLVYICRINNQTFEEDSDNMFADSKIKMSQIISNVESDLNDLYYPTKRGVLICSKGTNYKIDFDHYTSIKHIRGNVPQIRIRYLELLNQPEELLQLIENYQEHWFMFAVIGHCINNIVCSIFELYKESHIKHTIQVGEEHLYYRTLKQLHAAYKTTGNRVTIEDVQRKVCSLDKSVLKKFLEWA